MAHQIIDWNDFDTIARINLNCAAPQPMLLLGRPGSSKTALIEHRLPQLIAEVHGVRVEDVYYCEQRVVGKDACEFGGVALPMKNDEGELVTTYTKPPLLVVLEDLCAEHPYVLVNFDELPQGNVDMHNLLSDVLNPESRKINGWALPENVFFAATGNRMADKSAAKRLPSHITDRLLIVELTLDVAGWIKNYAEHNVHPLIVAVAEAYAEDNDFFAETVPVEDTSYCTLRSLTQVGRQLDSFIGADEFNGAIPPVLEKMFAATIGKKAASTVVGYIAQHDKVPSKEDILSDPEGALVPDQTGFQALAGNIAVSAAVDSTSGEAVIQYLTRLRPDLQVSLATKLLRRSARNGWYISGPVAQGFIAKFHDLLPLVNTAGWK